MTALVSQLSRCDPSSLHRSIRSEGPIRPQTVKTVGEIAAACAYTEYTYAQAYEAAGFAFPLLITAGPIAPVVDKIPFTHGFVLHGKRHRRAEEFPCRLFRVYRSQFLSCSR